MRILKFALRLAGLSALISAAHAATPTLLNEAMVKWSAGKDDWAFTQRVRELRNDGSVEREHTERYDPSLSDDRRWHLLELDKHAPTESERKDWEKKKNGRPRKHPAKGPGEYLDIEHARVLEETSAFVRYAIELRSSAALLIQAEKLVIVVTVGRESKSVERVSVGLREPMRVALGLAKITDIELDVQFDAGGSGEAPRGGEVDPKGGARVALSKLGNRMEYEWSDFRRVTAYRPASASSGNSRGSR